MNKWLKITVGLLFLGQQANAIQAVLDNWPITAKTMVALSTIALSYKLLKTPQTVDYSLPNLNVLTFNSPDVHPTNSNNIHAICTAIQRCRVHENHNVRVAEHGVEL